MTPTTFREKKLITLLSDILEEMNGLEEHLAFFKNQVNENKIPTCQARKHVAEWTERFILIWKRFNKMLYTNKKYFDTDYKKSIIAKRNKVMIYFESDFSYFYKVEL